MQNFHVFHVFHEIIENMKIVKIGDVEIVKNGQKGDRFEGIDFSKTITVETELTAY